MKYLISPPEKSDLIIEPTQISEVLKSDWHQVKIQTILNPDRHYLLEWEITIDDRILEGMFTPEGPVFSLDGDIQDCAKFALWLRTKIDNKYPLFFYDQGYSADIELRLNTTIKEIIEQF